MPTPTYDAIVIGGGHNGLINAAYLARAGKRVLVLERRPILGGAAVTEEIFPGYRFTEFSYVVSLLRPEIIRELELPRHGLKILPLPSTYTPLPNGDYLAAWADHDDTRRELYRHSPRDADAYDDYARLMVRMAMAVKPLLALVPPDPASLSPRDLLGLWKTARYAASLSEKDLYALAKLITQSSADLLDDWFETDALKGTKSASGIIGTFLGPRSPGTAYVLLHHYMGEIDGAFRAWGFAKDGSGGVTASITHAARALGVEIRTDSPVKQVIVKNGRAAGVALENGDEFHARVVVSAADPKRTFLQFVEPKYFPEDFLTQIRNFRVRGSSGKLNLALSELPNFSPRSPSAARFLASITPDPLTLYRGAVSISPSIEYIERAYDDAKYGQPSRRPYIDIIIPSMIDPDMAPPGHHVMSCFVQYVPYDVEGGWSDERKAQFAENVISTLEEYAPNLRRAIVGMQVITPADIERIAGITGGNIFHGELLLHQLFFLRPAPQWADFRTPLPGYYLAASGAHPGGGVMGAAGKLAAQEILKDWK
ncbi:MAG: NAD(P)/FAD-dependent oxidoreductase [Anaerolineales bacterium]|nr:NAD(P)/FAD-dependent oxidoreductase [Anaerolineales bacterium]MDW8279107.1 NAD(P)/FAD-dependent oxidoreductase [Anaerolineales bacterium]